MLSEKISEKLKPISQIVDHLGKKKKSVQSNTHKNISIVLQSLYFTLINEILDSEQFIPLISLECKEIQYNSQKIIEKSIDKMRVVVPF